MKKLILCIIMVLAFGLVSNAQSVQKSGNNFTQVTNKKKSEKKETKTQYTYTDSKGVVYPIYLSSGGKAFIKKISKKGEEYPKYLPEVGKQINPSAYKENKK